jgi:hypothetical protein
MMLVRFSLEPDFTLVKQKSLSIRTIMLGFPFLKNIVSGNMHSQPFILSEKGSRCSISQAKSLLYPLYLL